MKKLLFILPVVFFTLALNAQQTEDEVYIGKKYGNFKGTGIIIPETDKPFTGDLTITGTVVGTCRGRCDSLKVQKADGTFVIVGTRDNRFTLPSNIVGKKIIIKGIYPETRVSEIRNPRTNYQKNIQFGASGIKVIRL